jgi:hypothetical protein
MLLEVVREVQHGLVQHAALGEQERDQQPPDAAVAVEERVNRLELDVGQRDLDERWQVVVAMEELLQLAERRGHHMVRGRHERRVVQPCAGGTDPVLAGSQFAGLQTTAAHAFHLLGVDFADQAHGHRQLGQAREPMVHRAHVVDDLVHIARQILVEQLRFGREQVLQ